MRSKSEKYHWLFFIAIITFSFVIRLIYINQLSNSIFSKPFALDEAFYDNWGLSISRGHLIGKTVFYGLPLYPYFLGFIYWFFGHSIYIVRLAQALFGTLNCIMIYALAVKIFPRKIGLLSALLFSLYGQFLFHEGHLLSVTIAIFLNLVSLLSLMYSFENKGKIYFLISGLLIGLSSLAMSGILMIIPFVIFLAYYFLSNKIRATISIFLLLLGISVPIGLSMIHNYLAEKDLVLVSAHGGMTFYTGNNPNAKPYFNSVKEIDGTDIQSFIAGSRNVAERDLNKRLKPSEISSYWAKKAFIFISSNPLKYLRLMSQKFLFLCNSKEIEDVSVDYHLMNKYMPVLSITFLNFFFIFPFAILGIYLSSKGADIKKYLLYSYILSYSLSIILFMVNSRYRLPLVPALIIFSAYGLAMFVKQLKSDKKILVRYSIILLAVVIFTSLPLLKNRIGDKEDLNVLGLSYVEKGDFDKAIETLKKGIELAPDYPSVYNSLGEAYYHKGQLQEAERMFKKAMDLSPNFFEAHNNLGVLYRRMNLVDKAIGEFKIAINLIPNSPDPHYNLGNAYLVNNNYESAIKEYAKSLEIIEKPEYYNQLGIAYMCSGQKEKAIETWKTALKIAPQNESIKENLKQYEQ